jgi:hypothetical protein
MYEMLFGCAFVAVIGAFMRAQHVRQQRAANEARARQAAAEACLNKVREVVDDFIEALHAGQREEVPDRWRDRVASLIDRTDTSGDWVAAFEWIEKRAPNNVAYRYAARVLLTAQMKTVTVPEQIAPSIAQVAEDYINRPHQIAVGEN